MDSDRFVQVYAHKKKRSDAKKTKYPVPSNKVEFDSAIAKGRSRDYNPKTFPVYIAKNIQNINEKVPKRKEYVVANRFLMSYKGELKLVKRDSSSMKVSMSKKYNAKVKVKNK